MARSKIALLMLIIMLLTAFGIAFGVAQAQTTDPAHGLLIYNVWVRPTAAAPVDGATAEAPLPGTVSGAYMTISNASDADVQLVGVSDSIAEMTMLHEMTMDSKGVMRMHMIDRLDIPAGKTVTLDSNGYHAMLMNVSSDIYPGQAVPLTLTFADGSGKTFDVQVAALATDTPPVDDPLLVANADAVKHEDGTLDTSLVLYNRGDQADTLTGAISASVTINVEATEIPAGTQVNLTDIHGLSGALKDGAFPLTLIFDSGKQISFAVPVQSSGENS